MADLQEHNTSSLMYQTTVPLKDWRAWHKVGGLEGAGVTAVCVVALEADSQMAYMDASLHVLDTTGRFMPCTLTTLICRSWVVE